MPAHSLTLHAQHREITRCVHPPCPAGPHCAHCNIGTSVRTPFALARSPRPGPPASGREPPSGLPLRPHPSGASRHLAWRRPQQILGERGEGRSAFPPRQTVPEPPDGPHLKPAASPVPRPLGGASVLTLATARAPGGFTCRGGAPGTGAKVCARLGLRGLPSGGRARRARTGRRARRLRAAPGRARVGRGGTPRPGPGRAAEAEGRAGKVSSEPPGAGGASLPGSPPFPVAPRGCPGRGGAGAVLVRHAGPREALPGCARSGSRAAGGGEINNARKRKTDVSLARASPASRPELRSRPRSPPSPPAPLQ